MKSGYAFALFDGEEAAKDAISKFNGKLENQCIIFPGAFWLNVFINIYFS